MAWSPARCNKASINAGGIAYIGTTELLAEHAGVEVVMMLANPSLRVALATTHLPLRAVAVGDHARRPSPAPCESSHRALRQDFALPAPRIAVLGLNPHAGEAGVLGDEEIEIIEPVLAALRAEGMTLIGPLPADTAFLPQKLAGFDAVLAMYHDQGLPVLKHAASSRRSTSRSACPTRGSRSTTAPRWKLPARAAPIPRA